MSEEKKYTERELAEKQRDAYTRGRSDHANYTGDWGGGEWFKVAKKLYPNPTEEAVE